VVDLDGVGEIDAVAGLDVRRAPGERIRLAAEATRLAVLPTP
jgi:thiamine transport system ATP-binding protein